MPKLLLDRSLYDHPEHFDDEIREYRSSKRYVPTALESLLFELAGHRCTICNAPWLEIHHIQELSDGGQTEYENLLILCPNCHTRVHSDGVPSKEELRHYKIKQEIAYELPIISRLSPSENNWISDLAQLSLEDQIVFSQPIRRNVEAKDQDEAIATLKKEAGYFHLQEAGIVSLDLEHAISLAEGDKVAVSLRIKLTSKGIRWLRYLNQTGRIPIP